MQRLVFPKICRLSYFVNYLCISGAQLKNSIDEFSVTNLTNYFESAVLFDVSTTKDSKIDVSILNASGNLIKQQSFTVYNGANNIVVQNLNSLTPGLYILQVRNKEQFVNEKIIKK